MVKGSDSVTTNSVALNWTATGDNGSTGSTCDPESGLKRPPSATFDGASVAIGRSVTPTLGFHTLTVAAKNRQGLKIDPPEEGNGLSRLGPV